MVHLVLFISATAAVALYADQGSLPTDTVLLAQVAGQPVMRLPGMSPMPKALAPQAALPGPVINDVLNAPNPFDSRKSGLDGQTQISYSLIKDLPVRITLYDLLGFRVRRWQFAAGQNGGRQGPNQFLWDGTNENNQKVSKGGYLAQIEIETPDTVVTVIRKIGVIH